MSTSLTITQQQVALSQLANLGNCHSYNQIYRYINSKANHGLGVVICYNPIDGSPCLIVELEYRIDSALSTKLTHRELTDNYGLL